ncbi:MAG: PilT/PilU family type 4a pilus ATPase [Deltaproteobacteria bacterium]|nr:PilT/PilU family type 4a pilus ATPase [Deltaproteobacteria bacterium]
MKIRIENLLDFMVQANASDCYVSVGAPVGIRIEGETKFLKMDPLTEENTEELLKETLTDNQIAEFYEKNELNCALYFRAFGRFRLNVFRQKGLIGFVIRRIKSYIPSLEELNLPSFLLNLIKLKSGLVLVVGPTGSGKTTTLASLIDYRNKNFSGHIVTLEDPIEFYHEHKKSIVTQREIGIDTKDFQTGLKNALRQAPDVILVGEIRDSETMETAIHTAQTGHLCLATLHSSNAVQTLERILNFFEPTRHSQLLNDLSSCLRSIVAQRLVRSINDGRVPAVEIMIDSPRIKDLVARRKFDEIPEAIEKGSNYGMISFDQSLFNLYTAGLITLEEALSNAESQNNLRLKIKMNLDKDFGKTKQHLKLQ